MTIVYEGKKVASKNVSGFSILMNENYLRTYSEGVYFWTPKGAKLLYSVFKMFENEVLIPQGYERAIFPKMINERDWEKSRHRVNMAKELFFLSTTKEDEWEKIEKNLREQKDVPKQVFDKSVSKTDFGYCHSVCTPVYGLFSQKEFRGNPIKWYDFSGVSLRSEKKPDGLKRLREFHMVDAVMIGKENEVSDTRKKLIESYKKTLDKLEINYRFFMNNVEDTPKSFNDYSVVPGIIDFQVEIHKGEWLEVGSSFYHGRQFTKRFDIKGVVSSCAAIGLDRWILALTTHHGLNYPEILQKYMAKHI